MIGSITLTHDHNAPIKIANDTVGVNSKPGVVKTCAMGTEYVNGDRDWVDDDGWMQENDVYPPPEHHHIEEHEIHYHKK